MNSILSDFNEPRYQADVISDKYYQDFSCNFIHPTSGRVLVSTDLDAVANSIKNIILTERGTRVFNPRYGTFLRTLLFEHQQRTTSFSIETEIRKAISIFEPRAKIINLDVIESELETSYDIKIT